MSDAKYYYCTKHGTVEGEDGCRAADRLGPYDTREEAARALEIAAERTKSWDDDPAWNDDDDESPKE
ncbi:hypothetical protein [Aeromicrobium chenweiae]|uniref:Uncharacterized protein n=1 Tax=Aeromicrobium chenweiae TaxID=2079793 RepID=A0A2S0WKK5_9ACTN|nr:hypothetical protein [Aeromicrobium chenweiae]AWB91878.1 hypothetical protein C3E78_06505 [Aeromicrobium chenweiae]TGN32726.1 hypothetical protein E4L97_08475 [Aeromicrobium chenweiae]